MSLGAFAMLDCLGFKGVWKRSPDSAMKIIGQLKSIEAQIKNDISDPDGVYGLFARLGAEVQISFLSDTVTIGILTPKVDKLSDVEIGRLISIAVTVSIQVMRHFLSISPPLAMRGCITYGEYISDGNFIIGEAVDEAASLHELAQGAFVWIAPSAERYLIEAIKSHQVNNRPPQSYIDLILANIKTNLGSEEAGKAKILINNAEPGMINKLIEALAQAGKLPTDVLNVSIPIKGNPSIDCYVANPLAFPEKYRGWTFQMLSKAMEGDAIDVIIKRQNSLKFLNFCQGHMDLVYKKIRDLLQ